MTLVYLFLAEILLGVIVGFILSDNRRGLSVEEVKISSILFLLSTIFVFFKNPQIDAVTYSHLALSWFILIIGVLLGELIKLRIISQIVRSIQKKDIQLAINELVALANETQYTRRAEDKDALYRKLYDVQERLRTLSQKAECKNDPALLNRLHYLFNLCEDYVGLSITIHAGFQEGREDNNTTSIWLAIGKELTSLSWDTLNHAEDNVKNELGKAFSMKVVRKALHL